MIRMTDPLRAGQSVEANATEPGLDVRSRRGYFAVRKSML